MSSIQLFSSVLGLAVAAGLNLYAAVLMVGLGLRFHWISGLPGELDTLANPVVLSAAGVMYALEFFADKVPYVSVAWDTVHTFVRPIGGAALALATTAHLSPEMQALAMLAGGTVALGTHSTKMGYRLIAHASPEPVSGSVFSLAEDAGSAGLVLLTYQHPAVALGVIVAILIGIAIVLPFIVRVLTLMLRGLSGRVTSWFSTPVSSVPPPAWLAPELPGLAAKQIVPCFARRVPKAPWIKRGYLVFSDSRVHFAYRGLVRPRVVEMECDGLSLNRGVIFDLLGPEADRKNRWSVYLTKDCTAPADQRLRAWEPSTPGG
jgi:hypothetical protein